MCISKWGVHAGTGGCHCGYRRYYHQGLRSSVHWWRLWGERNWPRLIPAGKLVSAHRAGVHTTPGWCVTPGRCVGALGAEPYGGAPTHHSGVIFSPLGGVWVRHHRALHPHLHTNGKSNKYTTKSDVIAGTYFLASGYFRYKTVDLDHDHARLYFRVSLNFTLIFYKIYIVCTVYTTFKHFN